MVAVLLKVHTEMGCEQQSRQGVLRCSSGRTECIQANSLADHDIREVSSCTSLLKIYLVGPVGQNPARRYGTISGSVSATEQTTRRVRVTLVRLQRPNAVVSAAASAQAGSTWLAMLLSRSALALVCLFTTSYRVKPHRSVSNLLNLQSRLRSHRRRPGWFQRPRWIPHLTPNGPTTTGSGSMQTRPIKPVCWRTCKSTWPTTSRYY